jgi:hypothetical protein
MSDKKRHRPYVWVTWITKLLGGDDRCLWKAWYKSQYKYEKQPETPERQEFFAKYTAKHDAITRTRAAELKALGYLTKEEDENKFKLQGKAGDLAGKPDLTGIKDDTALVVEAKSGKRREADLWQVLVYLFALPRTWMKGSGLKLVGEVEYANERRQVPPLDEQRAQKIGQIMQTVTGPDIPPTSPSFHECRYCDIIGCEDKVTEDDTPTGSAGGYF